MLGAILHSSFDSVKSSFCCPKLFVLGFFFIIEGLNRKQHYNCFSEECWFIHTFLLCGLYMVCLCFPPCAFIEMGTAPFPQSTWSLFSPPLTCALIWVDLFQSNEIWFSCKDALDSYLLFHENVKQLQFIWPKQSWVEIRVQVIDRETEPCFMCNFRDRCLKVRSVEPRRLLKLMYCILLLQAAFNLSNVYFLRIRRRVSKILCYHFWKSKLDNLVRHLFSSVAFFFK